jgi:hypothetical protein
VAEVATASLLGGAVLVHEDGADFGASVYGGSDIPRGGPIAHDEEGAGMVSQEGGDGVADLRGGDDGFVDHASVGSENGEAAFVSAGVDCDNDLGCGVGLLHEL